MRRDAFLEEILAIERGEVPNGQCVIPTDESVKCATKLQRLTGSLVRGQSGRLEERIAPPSNTISLLP